MMILETIKTLEQSGVLKKLVDAGFISTKVLFYYETYLEYDKLKRTTKKTTTTIVSQLSDEFRVSEDTIYKIIRTMKK